MNSNFTSLTMMYANIMQMSKLIERKAIIDVTWTPGFWSWPWRCCCWWYQRDDDNHNSKSCMTYFIYFTSPCIHTWSYLFPFPFDVLLLQESKLRPDLKGWACWTLQNHAMSPPSTKTKPMVTSTWEARKTMEMHEAWGNQQRMVASRSMDANWLCSVPWNYL